MMRMTTTDPQAVALPKLGEGYRWNVVKQQYDNANLWVNLEKLTPRRFLKPKWRIVATGDTDLMWGNAKRTLEERTVVAAEYALKNYEDRIKREQIVSSLTGVYEEDKDNL
jgi:hypothetical protein